MKIPWKRYAIVLAACFLGGGIVQSWSTVADLFVDAGVFSDGCENVVKGQCNSQNKKLQTLFFLASAILGFGCTPSGLLFDISGPTFSSTAGFGTCVVSYLLVFLAVSVPPADFLIWITVPALQIGQNLATWGAFGFIFVDKRRTGLTVGLGNGAFLLSPVVLSVVVLLVSQGVRLSFALLMLAGVAAIAGVMNFFTSFSLAEYKQTTSASNQPTKLMSLLKELIVVLRQRPLQLGLFAACSTLLNLTFSYYLGSVFQFNNFNLTPDLSSDLAKASSLMFPIFGFLSSVSSGYFFDRFGMVNFCWLYFSLCLLATILVWWPSFAVQVIASAVMFIYVGFWLTLESKFPAIFAPSHLYGVFLGFFNTLTGLVQLIFALLIGLFGSAGKREDFFVPFGVLFPLASIATLLFALSLRYNSPVPHDTPDKEADHDFADGNLIEADDST
jgi:hypothetical protein